MLPTQPSYFHNYFREVLHLDRQCSSYPSQRKEDENIFKLVEGFKSGFRSESIKFEEILLKQAIQAEEIQQNEEKEKEIARSKTLAISKKAEELNNIVKAKKMFKETADEILQDERKQERIRLEQLSSQVQEQGLFVWPKPMLIKAFSKTLAYYREYLPKNQEEIRQDKLIYDNYVSRMNGHCDDDVKAEKIPACILRPTFSDPQFLKGKKVGIETVKNLFTKMIDYHNQVYSNKPVKQIFDSETMERYELTLNEIENRKFQEKQQKKADKKTKNLTPAVAAT